VPLSCWGQCWQINNDVYVFFSHNSTEPILDDRYADFFTKLAERLKVTEEKLQLTGHMDNTGTAAYNQHLGLRRVTIKLQPQ